MGRICLVFLSILSLGSHLISNGPAVSRVKGALTRDTEFDESFAPLLIDYQKERIELLRELGELAFQSASEKNRHFVPHSWCLFCFGSTGSGISLPASDLEFGILVSELSDKSMEFIQGFIEIFHSLCLENGISFDEKGWHPRYKLNGHPTGFLRLINTPQGFAQYCFDRAKPTLLYALYFAKPFSGDPTLFDDWKALYSSHMKLGSIVLKKEVPITLKNLRSCDEISVVLRGELGKARRISWQVPIKHLTIKPLCEWIQYKLMMETAVSPGSLFEGIQWLEDAGKIDSSLAMRTRETFMRSLYLKNRLGSWTEISNLSDQDINTLLEANQVIHLWSPLVDKRGV